MLPYLPEYADFRDLKLVYIVGQYFGNSFAEISEDDILNVRFALWEYGVLEQDGSFGEMRIDKFAEVSYRENDFDYFELKESEHYWNFEFYNKAISLEKWNSLNQKLKEYLEQHGIVALTPSFAVENIKQIAEIYKHVFGNNPNVTSIIMKHYPERRAVGYYPNFQMGDFWYGKPPFCCPVVGRRNRSVSILTGDAEFDDYLRKRVFEDLSSVSVLQIPHHGAKDNWSKLQLPNDLDCRMVLSFGLGNKHNHPAAETVDGILAIEDSELISVNQSNRYSYFIIV